ncbi:MAG: hypothetical protein JWM53_2758 [bacterium]|nr:hypothetical protein [bacterium]
MSPVRRSILLVSSLVLGCAPTRKEAPPAAAPTAGAPAAGADRQTATAAKAAAAPKCNYSVRRVSASGRGALRPQVAALADAFAVAWEETTDHRSIRVQTFALDAQPLGSSIEVADVSRSAAEPRLTATPDGDGFAVFWSTESVIEMRRIDRAGKPKSDAIPVVTAPGARALDVTTTENGYALAWWNWSGTPHQLAVTMVDKDGRAAGKPLPITRAPSPDPTVDITRGATLGRRAPAVLAWDETIGDLEHVLVGDLGRDRLEGRVDLGPGETPRIGAGLLIWERPSETEIWSSPLTGAAAPARVTDGHVPAAAARAAGDTALCYLRDTAQSEDEHIDELICGDLVDGKIADGTRIAVAPRGIFALQLAASNGRIGVAWESKEEDDTGVSFAALTCPEASAAAKAPK